MPFSEGLPTTSRLYDVIHLEIKKQLGPKSHLVNVERLTLTVFRELEQHELELGT